MVTQINQKVFSVNSWLHGTMLEMMLEQAGIPVELRAADMNTYLDVYVPQECAFDAFHVLHPELAVEAAALSGRAS